VFVCVCVCVLCLCFFVLLSCFGRSPKGASGRAGGSEAKDRCVERKIDKVEARVEALEGKAELTQREERELEQKRPYLTALHSNLSELRAKEARLEERLHQSREEAGTRFFFFFPFFFFFFFFFFFL
jgi:hypothetical protein